MKQLTVCIGLIGFMINSSYGFDTLFINQTFQFQNLQNFAYAYECSDKDLRLDSILRLSDDNFYTLSEAGIALPPRNKVYWIRVILKNQTDSTTQLILEVNNPVINYLQFFNQRSNQIDSSRLMGDNFPFDQREILHSNFLYSIELPPFETQQLYIYLNNSGEPMLFDVNIARKEYFYYHSQRITFLWSLFLGILICICALGIIATVISLEKGVLYYTLYCIFGTNFVLYASGFGFEYIWSSFETYNHFGGYINFIPMLISFLLLTRFFLETRVHLPQIDFLIKIILIAILFIFLPFTLFNYSFSKKMVLIMTHLGELIQLVIVIIVSVASINIYQKTRQKTAIVFLVSFSFFMFSMVFYLLTRTTNMLPVSDWNRYGIYLFWVVDIFFLTGLIFHRIKATFIKNLQLQYQLSQSQLHAANALLEGQLDERQRLSSELHDGISIKMALLRMELAQFFSKKSIKDNVFIERIGKISEDIRAFTHAIAPLNLNIQTLEESIEDLAYQVEQQTSLRVNLNTEGLQEEQFTKSVKHSIFQTIQELINNTVKYAEATEIHIHLEHQTDFILKYTDNGNGFDTSVTYQGLGLKNIEARAALLNGTFKISSNENGSTFEVRF